ncbi:MAG: TRAP transporter substrate-binding protein [Firmicutes bacterium]|nr:TRAP transporter substrate-binding protein [Bacillota bacterium]
MHSRGSVFFFSPNSPCCCLLSPANRYPGGDDLKKIIFGLIAVALLFSLLSGCTSGEDGVYDLKLAHFFPAAHPAEKELVQRWIKAVEETTGGRVRITSFPHGTLIDAENIYEGVVEGAADIGLSCFSYTGGRFPLLEVFELPGIVYENSEAASRVAWEGIKRLQPREVQDTKLMMVWATGPGDLFSTVPVKSLDDLRDLKVRAPSRSAVEALLELGAIPESMPQTDVYDALRRNMLQANLSPLEVLKGWNQAEVTNYVTVTPFLYNMLFFLTINLDLWNSFPEEIRLKIEQVNEQIFEEVAAGLWDSQNREALQYAREKGVELISLSEEETRLWLERLKAVQDHYVRKMEEKNLPGREALALVKQLAEEFNSNH